MFEVSYLSCIQDLAEEEIDVQLLSQQINIENSIHFRLPALCYGIDLQRDT
jgi:hypothetical protein